MRLKARIDGNQQQIVAALRRAGATVEHLHQVGKGVPDLLVGYRHRTYLLECKPPKGKLTKDEARWIQTWLGGTVYIVRSELDAYAAIGLEIIR